MKKYISYAILILFVPLLIIIGTVVFNSKQYSFISMGIAVTACAAVFLSFEKGRHSTAKLLLISVMTALSVAGRFIFASLPGFKPVTAVTVIAAMYLGPQAGFLTGSLSAFISNFYFGQGPWTPFQMLAWGIIGLLAGLFEKSLKKSKLFSLGFAAFSGALFSFIMDIWTVIWQINGFSIARYAAAIVSSAKFTAIYAISNVVFIAVLSKPIGRLLERTKNKYGIN